MNTMEDFQKLLTAIQEDSSDRVLQSELSKWNRDMESLLSTGATGLQTNDTSSADVDRVFALSIQLRSYLLSQLCGLGKCTEEDILQIWQDNQIVLDEATDELLSESLRVCKNWLRWYLQLFLPTVPTAILQEGSTSSSKETDIDPLVKWRSRSMLELYLAVLETCSRQQKDGSARYASQLLFYASYLPVVGTSPSLAEDYNSLIEDNQLYTRILTILVQSSSVPLALSLMRNVHNTLVSYPKAASSLESTDELDLESLPTTRRASWAQNLKTITYKSAFLYMIDGALTDEPPFPGHKEDLRADLVAEILHILYASKAGRDLEYDDTLSQTIVKILKLDADDDRVRTCQLATLSILIDAHPSFGDYLLAKESVLPLLTILETKVSQILDTDQVNDSGAAAVTPVLIALYRFSVSSKAFQKTAKDYIFPQSENFQQLVAQEEKNAATEKKNMCPLDAPSGTIRSKLIQLLTWPHGHVKRFANEFLWSLCGNDPKEFTYRVGMGNALPFLHSKGMASMPSGFQL